MYYRWGQHLFLVLVVPFHNGNTESQKIGINHSVKVFYNLHTGGVVAKIAKHTNSSQNVFSAPLANASILLTTEIKRSRRSAYLCFLPLLVS